jgi:uncharacterized membrane protein (DUF485 family)
METRGIETRVPVEAPTGRPEPDTVDLELDERDEVLERLASRRTRFALMLTAGMLAVYFGFVLLIAFDKALLGRILTDGLSLGILLGVVVVLSTWGLTWIYVRWANRTYEPELERLRR